jgi:hypothetical protein
MGKNNGLQGQSVATIDKERRIGSALTIGMKIASAKHANRGFSFWHYDANSGSGWNDEFDVPGSPMVFWQAARASLVGLTPKPFFCDFNPLAMSALQARLKGDRDAWNQSCLLPGDNEEGFEVFAECIRRSPERNHLAIGSVLVDPNGYFYRGANGAGAPVRSLQWFCPEFPRIDIIVNLNIRVYNLQASHTSHVVEPPRQVLSSLGKEHWVIGKSYKGQSRFVIAIGRNVRTEDHKRLGLYDIDSEIGQLILDAAEGKRRWSFIDDLLILPGVSKAPGTLGGESGGNANGERTVSLRSQGQRGPSSTLSAMGNVRRTIEPFTDLSSLPLFNGGKE